MQTRLFFPVMTVFLLSACLVQPPPSYPAQQVETGEQLVNEDFESRGEWDTYQADGLYLDVEEGAYTALLDWPARFIWGLNRATHDNALLEVTVRFHGGDRRAMAGILCRASPQNTGSGYYFLISASGTFSIRRGTPSSVDALVSWQGHRAIHTDGRANLLRAVCTDDVLQFYVNGEYLDGVQDNRYHSGYSGLVVGLPPNASQPARVSFDNLRMWEAQVH